MKKYQLFPLRDTKGVATSGQCIVGFVGSGRMDTHERDKEILWVPLWHMDRYFDLCTQN